MKAIKRVDVYTGGQWMFSTITTQAAAALINHNKVFGLVIHHNK
jgi:hypothetical protein